MPNITFKELLNKFDSNKHVILDIRKKEKYLDNHVPGSIHFVIGDILSKAENSFWKDKEIYVYCNSGNSSKLATNILLDLGYNAFNIIGGFSEYILSIK